MTPLTHSVVRLLHAKHRRAMPLRSGPPRRGLASATTSSPRCTPTFLDQPVHTRPRAHRPHDGDWWLKRDRYELAIHLQERRLASSRMMEALSVSAIVGTSSLAGWTVLTLMVIAISMAIPTTVTSVITGAAVGAVLLACVVVTVAISVAPTLWAAYDLRALKHAHTDPVRDLEDRVIRYGRSGTDARLLEALPIVRFLELTGHGQVARHALHDLCETLGHAAVLRQSDVATQAMAVLDTRASQLVRRLSTLALEVSRTPSPPLDYLAEATHDVRMRNEAVNEVRLTGPRFDALGTHVN